MSLYKGPYVVCLMSYEDKTFKKEAFKAGMDYYYMLRILFIEISSLITS